MTNEDVYKNNIKLIEYNLFSSIILFILLMIDIFFNTINFNILNLQVSIIITCIMIVAFLTYSIYLLYKRCVLANKIETITAILDFIAMLVILIKISVILILKSIFVQMKYIDSILDIIFSIVLWISLMLKYLPSENLFKGNTIYATVVGILLMVFLKLLLSFYQNRIIMIISTAVNSLFLIVLLLKMIMVDKIEINTIGNLFKFTLLFLLNVILNIYLIYLLFWNFDISGSQDMFMAISSIYGCVLGGILTLGGVAWTISKSREDSEKLRKDSIRPFFYGTPYYKGPNGDKSKSTYKKFGNQNENDAIYIQMILNSDKIEFLLKSVIINNKIYECSEDRYISKSELFELCIYGYEYKDKTKWPSQITLVVEDVDGNELYYKIELKRFEHACLPEKISLIKQINS